jgi:hypothetical protein
MDHQLSFRETFSWLQIPLWIRLLQTLQLNDEGGVCRQHMGEESGVSDGIRKWLFEE